MTWQFTLSELTRREREAAELLAQGYSSRGIAEKMWLKVHSAERLTASVIFKCTGPAPQPMRNRRVVAALVLTERLRDG